MIEPTSKITIPEKLCDINQSQVDQLRLLTSSSSSEVASRGGSRAAATSKMERFVIIVNIVFGYLISRFGDCKTFQEYLISRFGDCKTFQEYLISRYQ